MCWFAILKKQFSNPKTYSSLLVAILYGFTEKMQLLSVLIGKIEYKKFTVLYNSQYYNRKFWLKTHILTLNIEEKAEYIEKLQIKKLKD